MSISALWSRFWSRYCTVFLLLIWIAGSASGILFALMIHADVRPMLYDAISQPLSLIDILVVDLLPFLICTLAVSCSEIWVLPVVSFLKASAFSFTACAISMAFGESGWLIRFLLLFSNTLLLPVFCLYCQRYIRGNKASAFCERFIWFLIAAAIGCLDYFLVSPFLAELLR